MSPVVAIVTEDDTVHWALMDFAYSGGLLEGSEFAAHFNSLSSEASELHLDIRFGPFELERVPIEIDQEGRRVGQLKMVNAINRDWRKRRYTMIVGRDVLKHFLVSVDFQRALVVLEVPDT